MIATSPRLEQAAPARARANHHPTAGVSRLQGLLALIILPVCLPLAVASTQLTIELLDRGESTRPAGATLLTAFDVVYVVVS